MEEWDEGLVRCKENKEDQAATNRARHTSNGSIMYLFD